MSETNTQNPAQVVLNITRSNGKSIRFTNYTNKRRADGTKGAAMYLAPMKEDLEKLPDFLGEHAAKLLFKVYRNFCISFTDEAYVDGRFDEAKFKMLVNNCVVTRETLSDLRDRVEEIDEQIAVYENNDNLTMDQFNLIKSLLKQRREINEQISKRKEQWKERLKQGQDVDPEEVN